MKSAKYQRITKTDPFYKNELLAKFINHVMKEGKRHLAQKLVYTALSEIEKKGENALQVFEKALGNVTPRIEVRSKRVGGAAYQVPTEVRGNRRLSLAFRWLIAGARSKSNKEFHTFSDKLSSELVAAAKNEGEAVKKRNTAHKMAEANKVFSHFRW